MKDEILEDVIQIALSVILIFIILYASFGRAKAEGVEAIILSEQVPTNEPIRDTETVEVSTHTIAKGDTVYSIAREHGLNARTLISINNCGKCNTLKVGDTINLE